MKVYEFLMIADKSKDIVLMEEYNSSATLIKSYVDGFIEQVGQIQDRTISQISFSDEENEFRVTYRSNHTEHYTKHLLNNFYAVPIYQDTDSVQWGDNMLKIRNFVKMIITIFYVKYVIGQCKHSCLLCKYRNECFDNLEY